MQSLGDILFKLQQGDGETRVIFLSREKLGKIKQKEQNRLPARVTNVGLPMMKNIEWTCRLEYPQRRISSIEYLEYLEYLLEPCFSLALKTVKMIGRTARASCLINIMIIYNNIFFTFGSVYCTKASGNRGNNWNK